MAAIPFNRAPVTGGEIACIEDAIEGRELCGDAGYGKRCQAWFDDHFSGSRCFLTPSCTHALEMSALLIDIEPGDEVIMPSFTFVSTANAFALRGATVVFVDIRPDTLNLDESLVGEAITENTRAIVPVHYAGVSCDMDELLRIARDKSLLLIEDAAQGINATWRGRRLGSLGDIGAISFHETKNLTSGGEGGLLVVNDDGLVDKAEIVREKGTNRSRFFRGLSDKYSWVDLGSSYLPSELQAAYLWAQLQKIDEITKRRLDAWHHYRDGFADLADEGVGLPYVPDHAGFNGHIFYLLTRWPGERDELIDFLRARDILAVFHYVPLHSAPAGPRFSRFHGEDRVTTRVSEQLVRLPLFDGIGRDQQDRVIDAVRAFYAAR